MALPSELLDLVAVTQGTLGKAKFTDLSGDTQKYVAFSEIFKKEKVKFDSGKRIDFNVMTDDSGAARDVEMGEADDYDIVDVMTAGNVEWKFQNTFYAIEERELVMNSGAAKIVDLVKIRRSAAWISFAKHIETRFWQASSTDAKRIHSINYWAVYNATVGFNGGAPSGFTTVGGINPSTETRWKNYTGNYVNATKADLIRKIREGATKTHFESPVDIEDYRRNNRRGYYLNYDTRADLEDECENQNENLGNDLASKDGSVTILRNPCVYVPELDNNSVLTDPVYGIDWGVFYFCFMSGWFMKEHKPRKSPTQHNMIVTDIDNVGNTFCTDRRSLMVFAKA